MFNKYLFVLIAVVLISITSCDKKDEPISVNLEEREAIPTGEISGSGKTIRIAVGGMITPKEGLAYYKHFLDYIGKKSGYNVVLVDRNDYAEINGLLRKGSIDAAFVCSGPYVDGHRDFGLELLVAPKAYGRTEYYSYIIVAKESPITDLEGLRGKSFAFTDPLSNSGTLVPTFMLSRMNETPDTFFKSYIYTKAHDKSIKAVAQGIVDGAAVDSLIWEYLNLTNPEFTAKTKIVRVSDPYAIPPVVVPRSLDPTLKNILKKIFLNAHKEEKGRELLKKMMLDEFVVIDDQAYDSVRDMKAWLRKQNKNQ